MCRDHDLARSLSSEPPASTGEDASAKAAPLTETLLSHFSCMNISTQDDASSVITYPEYDPREESSKEPNYQGARDGIYQCNSCMKVRAGHKLLDLRCEHKYCHPCLVQLFELSISDESLFPPRCCGSPIPRSTVQGLVGSHLIYQAERKDIERATTDRTYCSNLNCSTFILPEYIDGKEVACPECAEITYAECKKSAYKGLCVLLDEGKKKLY